MTDGRRRWLAATALCVVAILAAARGLAKVTPHLERDIAQEHINYATSPLTPDYLLEQTIVPRHNALSAIEFLIARYDQDRQLLPGATFHLTIVADDGSETTLREASRDVSGIPHNEKLRFDFEPIDDSKGQQLLVELSASGEYGVGLWASNREAYADGSLRQNGEDTPGDLHMVTFYSYAATGALRDAVLSLAGLIRWLPALACLLVLPGIVVGLILPEGIASARVVLASLVMCLSLAFWPLLLLWSGAVGLSLAGWRIWVVVAGLGVALVCSVWMRRGTSRARVSEGESLLPDVALALVLVIVLGTRLLQVRDLIVPSWVDSLHHTVVTRAISEQGMVPRSLEPYVAVNDFHYHFGFHANAAALTWLTGMSPQQAVLLLGQLLNAACALTVAALTTWWTKERWAGVAAAVVVGALSYMPAYYVSWGRYTQLAGLCLLPMVCLATGAVWQARARGLKQAALAGFLAAGLLVTHYRVAIFYVFYCAVYLLLALWRARKAHRGWLRVLGATMALAGIALALASPLLVRFATSVAPRFEAAYGGWVATEGVDTTFPWGLLQHGWTQPLLYAGGAGLVLAGVLGPAEVILILPWAGLCLLAANPGLFGLPPIWLLHNSSVVISFWLPVAILCGALVANIMRIVPSIARWVARKVTPKRTLPIMGQGVQRLMGWVLLATAVLLAAWGSWRMVNVVNQTTILVRPEDLPAIAWVRDNTPPDARFLVNSWRWQGDLRAGSDAGVWLTMLADRQVSLPCALYGQCDLAYRDAINGLASAVEDAETLNEPGVVGRLRAAGITHVYLGAKGGVLTPEKLNTSPHFQLLYTYGPTRVYALNPHPE